MITNIARRIGRYVALPVVSAGIIGGAALGLAGMANAATPSYSPEPRPGIVAVPQTKANPAAETYPGAWWDRHHPSLLDQSIAAQFIAPRITTARSAPRSGSSTPSHSLACNVSDLGTARMPPMGRTSQKVHAGVKFSRAAEHRHRGILIRARTACRACGSPSTAGHVCRPVRWSDLRVIGRLSCKALMSAWCGSTMLTLTTATDSGECNHVASEREFVAARSGAFGGDGDRLEGVVIGEHVD